MDRALLDNGYDADTLKLLGRAFDAACRQDLAGKNGAAAGESRLIRLALIILELAKNGERDKHAITTAAVKIMSCKETPLLSTAGDKRDLLDGRWQVNITFDVGERLQSECLTANDA